MGTFNPDALIRVEKSTYNPLAFPQNLGDELGDTGFLGGYVHVTRCLTQFLQLGLFSSHWRLVSCFEMINRDPQVP